MIQVYSAKEQIEKTINREIFGVPYHLCHHINKFFIDIDNKIYDIKQLASHEYAESFYQYHFHTDETEIILTQYIWYEHL